MSVVTHGVPLMFRWLCSYIEYLFCGHFAGSPIKAKPTYPPLLLGSWEISPDGNVTLYQPNCAWQLPPINSSWPVKPHLAEKYPGPVFASLTGSSFSPRHLNKP